jgi:putative phosphoesterase
MIVGIIADTHDRLPLLDDAVKRLNKEKVQLVLHAGDYVAPFVVPHFKPLKSNLIGVFGNNDGDRELLKKRFAELGAEIRGKFAEVKVDGLRIALLHGDETELLQSLIDVESHDVIVHGHTHEAKTYRKGKTLVINPGEVCGYLSEKPTMATLDTQTLDAKIIRLK